MNLFPLRQSTASQEIPLGRFVDSTDGNTEETALTIANTDIKIWKSGGTTEASKNSGGATHMANGNYYAVLDATDTDTIGPLRVGVHVSGALPVQLLCCVYPAKVYDSLFATTGSAPLFGIVDQGTGQSATASTAVLRAAAAFADDELIGCVILITSGTGAGQARLITDSVSATDTVAVSPDWTTTPASFDYEILAAPPSPTLAASLPAVNATHINGTAITSAAGIPEVKVNNIAADAITATSIAADAITAGKIAADAIGASELAADAATEIATAVFARAFSAAYGSHTFDELIKLMASVLVGKASGLATTTATYRNLADNANVVVATVDADGNRTAVTRTP